MHLCFVMPLHILENTGGGAEVQAWLYAKQMAKMGYELSYLTQSVTGKTGHEIIDGVNIYWVKKQKYFEYLNVPEYKKVLNKIRPDIIIQRMTSAITGFLGSYCKKNNIKFVWICTGDGIVEKNDIYKQYIEKAKKYNKSIINKIVFGLYALFSDYKKNNGIKNATFLFTQNEYQESKILKIYNRKSIRILSGHEVYKDFCNNRKHILWAGNLGLNKRPELFVELSRKINDQIFVMLGAHSDNNYLMNLFSNTGNNFLYKGKLPFYDTLRYFDESFIYVNTSLKEGFPNTFIQAWLRGVPVISFGVDPDDVIKKNNLGYVVTDINEATEKINKLISDINLYSQLSENAKMYSFDNHSVEKVVEGFMKNIT